MNPSASRVNEAGRFARGSEDRAMQIHCARVFLTESRKLGATPFGWVLLGWARNARLRAAAVRDPVQGGLIA